MTSASIAQPAGKGAPAFGSWERLLAMRYLRARREHGGVALISTISFTGIFLAVAVLIIVMSVMNGFRAELLSRILGVNGHVFVDLRGMPAGEAEAVAARVRALPGVTHAGLSVQGQVMAVGRDGAPPRGAVVIGVDRDTIKALKLVSEGVVAGDLKDWGAGEYGGERIALGERLSISIGADAGGSVQLISPNGAATAFGISPRYKDYQVGAVFSVGMSEYDETLIYMPLEQARLFFSREDGYDMLDIRMERPDRSDAMMQAVAPLAAGRPVSDWKMQSQSLVQALAIERNVMRLILMLIVAIAAMNIISGLIMLVMNKGRDIAILRTMGASRGAILRIFVMAGASVGILGTLAGVAGGIVFCLNIGAIQGAVEAAFGPVFDADIYFLSRIPARIEWAEVAVTGLFAAAMSVLATLPPAWRAARLDPVEALRYE